MPEISVVMPVYNGEEYLSEAIDSIRDQSFGDFEFLIVCEHGSNEASMEIVERYAEKDKRIRPIYNSRRLGIAASLNVGLDAATGKYVARMDGDDISGRKRLEAQKAFLAAYPDIGLVGTSHTVLNSPNWRVAYVSDPELVKSQMLFHASPVKHPTIMFRSELTQKCRYDETLPGVEDYDLYVKFGRITKISNILDPSLFQYRRTGGNLSAMYSVRDEFIWKRMQREILLEELGLQFTSEQIDILHLLSTAAYEDIPQKDFPGVVQELEELLGRIEERNDELGVYRPECLSQTLRHRWYREKYKLDIYLKKKIPKDVMDVWSQSKYYSPWF